MNEAMWWLTVAAYGGTAVLCAACALKEKRNKGQRRVWWGLAASMAALGLNKQQDFTGLLTAWGRQNAWQANWYQARSLLQVGMVGLFFLMGLLFLLLLFRYRHTLSRLQAVAVLGVLFLFCFALVRAASLHAIDAFLYSSIAGILPNWLLELGGIVLVAVPALGKLMKDEG